MVTEAERGEERGGRQYRVLSSPPIVSLSPVFELTIKCELHGLTG